MIKLKKLLLQDWISHGIAVNRNPDCKLRPVPGGFNDGSPNWNGIIDGPKNEWFACVGENDWKKKRSISTITINETGKPQKIWIEIKTNVKRKPNDTNSNFTERVRKHSTKITRSWLSAAKRLHQPQLNEVGNPIKVSWKECFEEAIKDPKIQSYISNQGND